MRCPQSPWVCTQHTGWDEAAAWQTHSCARPLPPGLREAGSSGLGAPTFSSLQMGKGGHPCPRPGPARLTLDTACLGLASRVGLSYGERPVTLPIPGSARPCEVRPGDSGSRGGVWVYPCRLTGGCCGGCDPGQGTREHVMTPGQDVRAEGRVLTL